MGTVPNQFERRHGKYLVAGALTLTLLGTVGSVAAGSGLDAGVNVLANGQLRVGFLGGILGSVLKSLLGGLVGGIF